MAKMNHSMLFQFHYGTIKRQLAARLIRDEKLFQFHYGTIKSRTFVMRIWWGISFQFHYGTIKRREQGRPDRL